METVGVGQGALLCESGVGNVLNFFWFAMDKKEAKLRLLVIA